MEGERHGHVVHEKEDRAFSRRLIGSIPYSTLVNKGNTSTCHIERKKTKRKRENLGNYSLCFRWEMGDRGSWIDSKKTFYGASRGEKIEIVSKRMDMKRMNREKTQK